MGSSERQKIGILFNFNKNWLGGVYYIINIIRSLNYLKEDDKPEIIVFYNQELASFIKEIKYPYLTLVPYSFPNIYKGYFQSWLTRKNVFINDILKTYQLDGIYPLNDQPISINQKITKNTVIPAWFADLQHRFYPKFFTKKQWWLREIKLRLILKNTRHLAVSSNDVASHFKRFYKIKKGLKIHVLQFVSIIDDFSLEHFDTLKTKFALPDQYFIVSNQFHQHKNHLTVWKAVAQLIKEGQSIRILVTGKMENFGNKNYIQELRDYIAKHKLQKSIQLLGVVPRQDQLCLMKNATAVIQPSLFEGWSTVIEDAKSLQVPVIASNLEVNKEQLGSMGYFFNAEDENELASLLQSFKPISSSIIYAPYAERVQYFAENFIRLFNPSA